MNAIPYTTAMQIQNFNIPFPNSAIIAFTETTSNTGNYTETLSFSKEFFTYRLYDISGTGYIRGKGIWFAIGY